MQQVINAGQQAHYSFPEPMTLYVTYRTVTVGTDGTPVFRDDVYGRDKRVVRRWPSPGRPEPHLHALPDRELPARS